MSYGMDAERLRAAMGLKPVRKAKRPRGRPKEHTGCRAKGCDRPHHASGLCKRHYGAVRRRLDKMARQKAEAMLAKQLAEVTVLLRELRDVRAERDQLAQRLEVAR